MLLSTTYGLNNSHTKRLHVGLQTTNEGVFKPLVKLSGNNANGIYFDANIITRGRRFYITWDT